MRRWPSITVVVVAAAAALLPSRAEACKCPSPELREAVEAADVVFTGRARESTTSPGPETFTVEQVWKGQVPTTVQVDNSGGSCKFIFAAGARYLVFARGRVDALELDACSGTRHVDHAGDWLAALGPGVAAGTPASGAPASAAPKVARPAGCSVGEGSGPGLMLLLCAWRRRGRARRSGARAP